MSVYVCAFVSVCVCVCVCYILTELKVSVNLLALVLTGIVERSVSVCLVTEVIIAPPWGMYGLMKSPGYYTNKEIFEVLYLIPVGEKDSFWCVWFLVCVCVCGY